MVIYGVVIKTNPYKFRVNWPRYFLPSFESIGLLVQEKKWKIDFQDGCHYSHLGFPIGMISAFFYLQVTLMLPTKFPVNWPFGSGEEEKKNFRGYLGFPIGTILPFFDLQVLPMLPTKFWPHGPFGSGEEVKNRFSRWPPWQPSWISDRNNFTYFWSISNSDASLQVSTQLVFWFRKRREK